jgi:hypothetical protein
MQDIRKLLCWIFASTSLMYVFLSVRSVYTINQSPALLTFQNVLFVLFDVVISTITGLAWWTILKGKSSRRLWGIAASLMYFLIFLRPIVFSLPTSWLHHAGALFIGIVGLVAFLRGDEQHDPDENLVR